MPSEQHQTLTWCYKPIDMLVINFAVISRDIPNVIRFVDQTGYVFDRMKFDETTSLHEELIRNGCNEVADDDFIKLVGLPEAIKGSCQNNPPCPTA